ncbi:MAG: hypothetical protein EA357_01345 [Micavibrio sp.]|nr:MAG: hypothetical protein EA357_01345 [Micavibrio sp.]
MAVLRSVLSFLICLVFTVATPAFAEDEKDKASCPIYSAVFKPHPSYYTAAERSLDYRMTAEAPPAGAKGLARWHDFVIHIHDAADGTELSRYRVHLAFPLGGIIPTIGGARFYAATEDFSRHNDYETAPHAFIWPNFGTRFRHTDWERDKHIEFLTNDKIPPGPETPELWIFAHCGKTYDPSP